MSSYLTYFQLSANLNVTSLPRILRPFTFSATHIHSFTCTPTHSFSFLLRTHTDTHTFSLSLYTNPTTHESVLSSSPTLSCLLPFSWETSEIFASDFTESIKRRRLPPNRHHNDHGRRTKKNWIFPPKKGWGSTCWAFALPLDSSSSLPPTRTLKMR